MTRILLADDDDYLRAVLRIVLKTEGYEVETVRDGNDAIRAQAERPADVLITDIFMPERDGLETLEYFRARYPAMPIVAISGAKYLQKTDYLKVAQHAGADVILRKPFGVNELLEALRKLTARKVTAEAGD